MHNGKELEAHLVEKGSFDSDAPQVGSARSDTTRVVKLDCHQTNRRKTRPYSNILRPSRQMPALKFKIGHGHILP
jgi:hypothetical protein